MTAVIVPPEVLARRRVERDRERQRRQPWHGTILADDEPDHTSVPASRAERREPMR